MVMTWLSLQSQHRERIGRPLGLLGFVAIVLLIAGCDSPWATTPTTQSPSARPDELAAADDKPCPRRLPTGEDPSGHGFGTEAAATELPALLEPDEAWVCEYDSYNVRKTSNGGTVFGWRREGQPDPVDAANLPALKATLDRLGPVEAGRACTADLGPRWMVVYSHGGDLTGVVVDDYGCRDVRLTDNPRTTPPGADNQDGTVAGVLSGGAAILDALGIGR